MTTSTSPASASDASGGTATDAPAKKRGSFHPLSVAEVRRLTDEAIERHWPHIGELESVTVTKRDGYGSWGGRAVTVKVDGTKGVANPSGDDFRSYLGLRSTLFSVTTHP